MLAAFVAGIGGTLTTTAEAARQETARTLVADLVVTTDRPIRTELAGISGVGVVSDGLTRGQVVRMALREALAVAGIGLFLGGLAAAGTLVGMTAAMRDILGFPVVSVPWPLLAGLAVGVAAIVSVTSVLTTMSATRPALSPSGPP